MPCGLRIAELPHLAVMTSQYRFALQALGVAIDLGPEGIRQCLDESNIAFMYAPRYHPAMAAVRPVRGALKVCEGGGFRSVAYTLHWQHAGCNCAGASSAGLLMTADVNISFHACQEMNV